MLKIWHTREWFVLAVANRTWEQRDLGHKVKGLSANCHWLPTSNPFVNTEQQHPHECYCCAVLRVALANRNYTVSSSPLLSPCQSSLYWDHALCQPQRASESYHRLLFVFGTMVSSQICSLLLLHLSISKPSLSSRRMDEYVEDTLLPLYLVILPPSIVFTVLFYL